MLRSWAQRLQLAGLYALLALLPFSKAAVEICFGLLLLGWLLERLNPATREATCWWTDRRLRPVLAWLVAYLLVCAASIAVSDFPGKSARGFVSKWLEYLLFLVIAADLGARPGVAQKAVAVLAGSSFAVALQAIGQECYLLWLSTRPVQFPDAPFAAYTRMTGPYENPIDLATYLMVVIPTLVMWSLTKSGRARWLTVGLAALLAGAVVRTQASGAWLGLLAAAGLLVVYRSAVRPWLLAGLGALGVAALAYCWTGGTVSLIDAGAADRWLMWQAAIGMIQDRPWLGHGLNTFMANYLKYRVGGEPFPRYAHNCYLQVAAETGVIGLVAFLGLLGAIFQRVLTGARSAAAEPRLLLMGLGAGLLAFATQAALDTNFYALRQAALFWVLAGLAVGLSVHRE